MSVGDRGNCRVSRRRSMLSVVVVVVVVMLVVAVVAGACGPSSRLSDRTLTQAALPDGPLIVVTFPVTAALVAQLVGDSATVQVLMPNGVDPHDYRPSARDMEMLDRADLVVANGLGLEEGLTAALKRVEGRGTSVFWISDWVDLRSIDADAHGDHYPDGHLTDGQGGDDPDVNDHDSHKRVSSGSHEEEDLDDEDRDGHDHDGHDHGVLDPHFWVDPVTMAHGMVALAGSIETRLGLDMSTRLADLEADLDHLNRRVETILEPVAPNRRQLVTGHESLGYFADRYDFEIVGTVVSSLSSQASPSAADIASLKRQIELLGVATIFNEVGSPNALSKVIAEETGVKVVELNTHKLPEDRTYGTFMTDLATRIATGLETHA